jgi:hypothetical protein
MQCKRADAHFVMWVALCELEFCRLTRVSEGLRMTPNMRLILSLIPPTAAHRQIAVQVVERSACTA